MGMEAPQAWPQSLEQLRVQTPPLPGPPLQCPIDTLNFEPWRVELSVAPTPPTSAEFPLLTPWFCQLGHWSPSHQPHGLRTPPDTALPFQLAEDTR